MKTPTPAILLLLALGAAPQTAAESSDPVWNQWRGPQRNGQAQIFGTLPEWPKAPARIWDVEVGVGHASPVIRGETVYLHSRAGGDEVVAAYALADGSQRWSQRYPVSFQPRMGGGHHGAGPKSTPVVQDGVLVTFGITAVLSGWNAETGEQRWQIDFADWLKEPLPRWGVSGSPLIHDGRVYAHFGKDSGSIVALAAATGETIWRHDGVGSSYASPVLGEIDGRAQLVTLTADGLLALDLEGEKLWHYDFPMSYLQQNVATPILADGLVVIASEKRPTTAVRPQQRGDSWQVEVAWERADLPMEMSTAAVSGDRLCGLSKVKKGLAFCLDAAGQTVWLGAPRFAEHASIVSTPGALLYLLSDATLVVLESSADAYRELARYTVADSETWAHPAVIESGLIIKSHDRLARLDFAPPAP